MAQDACIVTVMNNSNMHAFSAASEAEVCEMVVGHRRHGLDTPPVMDQKFWDHMYGSRSRVFSGNPNPVLVQQISDVDPGRALDIGCGEGDDARWLAGRGWTVTASDISTVALERAASLTDDAASIAWTHADYLATPPATRAFDLVTMHYFAVPKGSGDTAARHIADAVASGGLLLIVNHQVREGSWQAGPGGRTTISPSDYSTPHEIAGLLGDGWTIEIDETRPRVTAAPEGSGHTHDTVVRARRD